MMRRLDPILAVGAILLGCAAVSATEHGPVPSPSELESVFSATGSAPWTFTPGGADAVRVLRAQAPWDLRAARAVVLRARVVRQERQAVRLRWMLETRVGAYASATTTPVPIVGTMAEVPLNLSGDASTLIPVGHQRPWDALAAAEVTALELRPEISGGSQPITLELRTPLLQAGGAAGGEAPRLLDVTLAEPPPDTDAVIEVDFRLDPLPEDPFAAEGEGDVRLRLPNGREVLAFLDQPATLLPDGWAVRRVGVGAPCYRALLPELPGDGEIVIQSGPREWRITAAALRSAGGATPPPPGYTSPAPRAPPADLPAEATERWMPPLRVPFPPPPDPWAAGPWQGAPRIWELTYGKEPLWSVVEPPTEQQSWRPVVFWNSRWGHFGGTHRPDLDLAARFDAELASAGFVGESHPLVLLDGEGFARQGTFTWLSHPLNVQDGGTLTGPGEMLRSPAGFEYCLRTARYALARWGRSRAVSCFVLTARPSTPGVADFHARMATALRGWLEQTRKPLYSLHPLTREPLVAKPVDGLDGRAAVGGAWRAGEPLPAQLTIVAGAGVQGGRSEGDFALEVTERAQAGSACAIKPFRFVAARYDRPLPDDFHTAEALAFDVWIPPNAPSDLRAGVHLRDPEGLWFQALLPGLLNPGDWTTCLLDLTGRNAHGLTGTGHQKAWTDYSRRRVTEIGLHVYTTHAEPLTVRFARVRGVRFERSGAEAPPVVELAEPAPVLARTGEVWEAHLRVSRSYANPFDPRQVDLTALITGPSGKTARVPAFFDQPCLRREEAPGGAEIVEPVGAERWTVRHRVLEDGPHKVAFELREGGQYQVTSSRWVPDSRFSPEGEPYQPFIKGPDDWFFDYQTTSKEGRRLVEQIKFQPGTVVAKLALPGAAFTSGPATPKWHGFLRSDADKRHFRFDDGSFYYALGPCLRSPSDNRTPYDDPKWDEAFIEKLGKRGTYQTDEYLAAFEKAGINWTRVWACSWFCGLQWRRDWPGYHGYGRYNLLNAWRLDHVLTEAEKRGVFISLCLTNHGQFSRLIDVEWENNPYNRLLGGPCDSAMEFFTRAESKATHQNYLRYVAARWGHSPAVLNWDLFSELEFVEEYRPCINWRGADRAPAHIDSWHQEMASFLKDVDPNDHLVGSHYSHPIRGYSTLALPQIDIAASNAYSAFDELNGGRCDAAQALHDFWHGCDYRFGVMRGYRVFQKPVLIEEQGRHWMGVDKREGKVVYNTRDQLDADLHAGLWGSLMQPLAGATGYWWWLHVHFDGMYGEYRALANFLAGEDLRAKPGESTLEPAYATLSGEGAALLARTRRSQDRAYVWVYHRAVPLRTKGFPAVDGVSVSLANMKAGKYTVEFWDTHTGQMVSKVDAAVQAPQPRDAAFGTLTIKLPRVQGDVALKVKKVD
jgi:hypothetical protein